MPGPPCLTPQKIWQAGQHARSLAHHISRPSQQPSPASLPSRAICVRPWPDSGLPRAFPPLIQEGRLPSLLVHPASLPIPPLWVTQRRLSSGQHTVSCPPGRRTTLRIHNPYPSQRTSELPRCGEEAPFSRYQTDTHRRCVAIPKLGTNPQSEKYSLPSYSTASDQDGSQLLFFYSFFFTSCLSPRFLFALNVFASGREASLLTAPLDRRANHIACSTLV